MWESKTIIAPPAFMEGWIGMLVAAPVMDNQPVIPAGCGVRKHSFISINDVARFTMA
ncbi:MAG: hypothetical protein IBX69_18080 [Anaerolineales bacterium]|nr:hypothetical protein [Anaerolineales bacterium]